MAFNSYDCMVFTIGKYMKKFLITMSPICAILFISMSISWGLKGVLVFFGAVLFYIVSAFGFTKWVEFVDKHIKD